MNPFEEYLDWLLEPGHEHQRDEFKKMVVGILHDKDQDHISSL